MIFKVTLFQSFIWWSKLFYFGYTDLSVFSLLWVSQTFLRESCFSLLLFYFFLIERTFSTCLFSTFHSVTGLLYQMCLKNQRINIIHVCYNFVLTFSSNNNSFSLTGTFSLPFSILVLKTHLIFTIFICSTSSRPCSFFSFPPPTPTSLIFKLNQITTLHFTKKRLMKGKIIIPYSPRYWLLLFSKTCDSSLYIQLLVEPLTLVFTWSFNIILKIRNGLQVSLKHQYLNRE